MRRRLLYFVIFTLYLNSAFGQEWTKDLNRSWDNSAVSGISTGADGNIYATGNYTINNNCRPGPENPNCISYTCGIFIARYTPSGEITWEKKIESPFIKSYALSMDSSSIYVMGIYGNPHTQEIAFDNVRLQKGNAEVAMFLVKYSLTGEVIWVKQLSGLNGTNLQCSNKGIYITGNVGIEYDPADSFEDNFLAKFTPEGELVWTKKSSACVKGALSVTPAGYVYTATHSVPASANEMVNYYSPEGSVIWSKPLPGNGHVLTTDEAGNCFITGHIAQEASFDKHRITSSHGSFIAKLDTKGAWAWAKATRNNGGRAILYDSSKNELLSAEMSDANNTSVIVYNDHGAYQRTIPIGAGYALDNITRTSRSILITGRMGIENRPHAYLLCKQ
jgi:hypothetical protein